MKKTYLTSNLWEELAYLTRYAGSGVINTIIGFVVIFCAMALGFSPMISNVLGYASGLMLGFAFSRKFVFRSNGHFVTESVRYLISFIISFLFNLMVLRLAMDFLNLNAVISQLAAAAGYTLVMYILTRLFVFEPKAISVKKTD